MDTSSAGKPPPSSSVLSAKSAFGAAGPVASARAVGPAGRTARVRPDDHRRDDSPSRRKPDPEAPRETPPPGGDLVLQAVDPRDGRVLWETGPVQRRAEPQPPPELAGWLAAVEPALSEAGGQPEASDAAIRRAYHLDGEDEAPPSVSRTA